MELELTGKVALITGASRGIGLGIARELSRAGCRVGICARGAEALSEARKELEALGASVCAVQADVTAARDRQTFVQRCAEELGGVDCLVHNAGGLGKAAFLESSDEDWDAALHLNTVAGVGLCRLAVPHMQARGGGSILFIASIWGREAGGPPAYNAAKAAEISTAKGLARELARHGIRVNSLAPGSILFPGGSWDRRRQRDPEGIRRFVEESIPLNRLGSPEEVGRVAAFLLSPAASWVTGACLPVDGGQSIAF